MPSRRHRRVAIRVEEPCVEPGENKESGAESAVWEMCYLAYPSFTAPGPFSRPRLLTLFHAAA